MPDGKILIMGVGGCGSGFIWGLLGACGLSTGGINEWIRHSGIREADDPKLFDAPRVIKHLGGFLNNMNTHLDNYGWEVEHVFFCVASLDLQMNGYRARKGDSFDYDHYYVKYQNALGKGLMQLIDRDHPFTVIRCPRSLFDPYYCWKKLQVVLGDMKYKEFKEIHTAALIPRKLPNECL